MTASLATLPVDLVHPNADQPRKHFDAEALEELADSIRTYGLLEPIIVRENVHSSEYQRSYQIIAGERRWRACREAGLTDIPVIIRDETDAVAFELSMVENVVRSDMNPVEEAEGYQRLLDLGADLDTLAQRLGKKRGSIENRLRLVRLAPAIRDLVRSGQMDAYDGALVAGLTSEGQFRVMRALTSGQLTHQGDLARLVSAIRLEESQATVFGAMAGTDGTFPPDGPEPTSDGPASIAATVMDHFIAAATALEAAADKLPKASDLDRLGAVADSIKLQAARVAAAVHARRASAIAQATR